MRREEVSQQGSATEQAKHHRTSLTSYTAIVRDEGVHDSLLGLSAGYVGKAVVSWEPQGGGPAQPSARKSASQIKSIARQALNSLKAPSYVQESGCGEGPN